jgi:hypothetical protein
VLDVTLPYVNDDELQTMIEQRVSALDRQLDAERLSNSGAPTNRDRINGAGSGGRGQITVQFFDQKRRKPWPSLGVEEVCWETWTIKVTVAEPRTENGMNATLFTWINQSYISTKANFENRQNEQKFAEPWSRPSSPPP